MDMSVEGVFSENGNIRRLRELTANIDKIQQKLQTSRKKRNPIICPLKKFLYQRASPTDFI